MTEENIDDDFVYTEAETRAAQDWVDADEEANPSRYESTEIETHTKVEG